MPDVTAVLVTRGDVKMGQILDSIPPEWPVVLWNNASHSLANPTWQRWPANTSRYPSYGPSGPASDQKVWGRYEALSLVETPLAFFQDDDCLLRPETFEALLEAWEPGYVVGNAFDDPVRLAKYHDTTLLGWGSVFEKHLPFKAFDRYATFGPVDDVFKTGLGAEITFPMLTPSKTITHGIEWLDDDGPVLERPNRMWKQPSFYKELDAWLTHARWVRDQP